MGSLANKGGAMEVGKDFILITVDIVQDLPHNQHLLMV